jgi:hypothetical protein
MDTYVKVFQSILDSTVWQENLPTKVVWITMLAMKDRRGYVGASIPGLAKRAGVTLGECEEALQKFLAPDPYSRSTANEGRKIGPAQGGWMVLNHEAYRNKMSAEDRRDYQRVKQSEYRARKKSQRELNHEAAERRFEKAVGEGDEGRADRIVDGDEV